MTDGMTLGLWRLVSDLTIEDAAILVAGGDPSAVDWEQGSFGDQQYPVKRTDGHPGFLAVFTSLKTAIRKGYLRAELAYEADGSGGYSNRLSGETWVMSSFDLSQVRARVPAGRGGRPISARGIAKLLKPYGIGPAQDRFGSFYRPTDFSDAFDRYLSQGGEKTTTSASSTTQRKTATEKDIIINGIGTCGAYGTPLEGGGYKGDGGAWEGEF